MIGMNYKLAELELAGKSIKVGIIGAGQMGRVLTSQLIAAKGMLPVAVTDLYVERAKLAYERAGLRENEDFFEVGTVEEASRVIGRGKFAVSSNDDIVIKTPAVDCVMDATGEPEAGAEIAVGAIENKKHIVMLDVETDVCIGPILYKMAQDAGVVYTGMAGDEPGAVMELYDFASAVGFEVRVIGKGKNNAIDYDCNQDTVAEKAAEKGCSPKMLTSFVDGTKTMVELTAMANATGFVPDVPGAHGAAGSVADLPKLLSLKSEGGILDRYGVVEYVNGVAPGVFAIVTSKFPEVGAGMKYISMGDGPNYVLYRPYHLTSLETPISVARAVLDHTPTIVPREGQVAETVAVAKRDIRAGDELDGIGGYAIRGTIVEAMEAKEKNLLPVSLAGHGVEALRDIPKGGFVTYGDVRLNEDALIVRLRKKQDEMFA